MTSPRLPGLPRQQALLRAVVQAFAGDASIVTIGVFGSTTRAECDKWSDVDLDVTVRAEHMAQAAAQIRRLGEYLDAQGIAVLLLVWHSETSAMIVCHTLERIDITIHTPETSKAEVLSELVLLRGQRTDLPAQGTPALSAEAGARLLQRLHDRIPLDALNVAESLGRGRLWDALSMLEQMRERVMMIYGLSRDSSLPDRYFRRHADTALQAALGETLAGYDRASIASALERLMALYQAQCALIGNERLRVSAAQTELFRRVEDLLARVAHPAT